MKILRVEPCEQFPKNYTLQIEFDKSTSKLVGTVGTFLTGEGDLILDIDIDLTKWVGKLVEFRIVMTEKGFELMYFDPIKNYAIANGMPSAPDNRREMRCRVFRIFVNEDIEQSIIQVFSGHEEIEGFENIIEDGDPELRMFNLIRRDADAAHMFKLARLKCAMLGVVDQRDSVSYIEAQVDILTRLVLELHNHNASRLVEILRQADAHSVLAIKGEDALSKEFLKKKAWVRTVQKDYYDAKQKLEAETTASQTGNEVQPELPTLSPGDEELL